MSGSKLTPEFIDKVEDFCEGPNSLEDDNTRLRDSFFIRYAESLSEHGDISYFDLMSQSLENLKILFKEYENESGQNIDDFAKGWIAYEFSSMLSKVYPTLDKREIFTKLLRPYV